MTGSLSLLAMALFVNMMVADDGTLDWKLPAAFGVCVGLMALCKLPYAAFCMLILAVPLKRYPTRKNALMNFCLVVGLVGAISVATLLFGADKGIIQWYTPGMSITGQIKYILTHPFQYVWLMLGQFLDEWTVYLSDSIVNMAYCGRMHRMWAVFAIAAAAAVALFDREEQAAVLGSWAKLLCLGTAVCSWVLVLTALYVSYNVVGRDYIGGVQGRYFFPLLLPLLLILKNQKLPRGMKAETMSALCGCMMAVMGIAAVWDVLSEFCM